MPNLNTQTLSSQTISLTHLLISHLLAYNLIITLVLNLLFSLLFLSAIHRFSRTHGPPAFQGITHLHRPYCKRFCVEMRRQQRTTCCPAQELATKMYHRRRRLQFVPIPILSEMKPMKVNCNLKSILSKGFEHDEEV
jgi:hypothetical protein